MSKLTLLASLGRRPAALALIGVAALGLSACGGKDRPRADLAASQVTTIGVNSYPWRASLDALHIYFPDPWPKKRHLRNRLVNRDNLRMFHDRLRPGGRIHLATDHPDYAAFIEKELATVAELFTRFPYGTADREVLTKWERKQIENGLPINYYLLEKR